jgi:LEA14-like dessication related protein
MNKNRIILYITHFIIAAFLTSCFSVQEVTVSNIQNVKVQSFDNKGATLLIGVTIKNPNPVKLKVTSGEMSVKLGKTDIGKAKLNNKIAIPAKSEQMHEFEVKTDLSTLGLAAIPMIADLLRSKKSTITMDGYIKGRALFISRKVDIKYTDTIDIGGSK